MIRCEQCGHENQPIFRFCLKCGAELPRAAAAAPKPKPKPKPEPEKRVCPHCGAEVAEGCRFCVECGLEAFPLEEPEPRLTVGHIVQVQADGSDGSQFEIYGGLTSLGSATGDHVFPSDDMMSGHHMDFLVEAGEVRVFDRESTYGTFIRISAPVSLSDGAQLRVGQQLLEMHEKEGDEPWGELVRLGKEGEQTAIFPLSGENVFVGRDRGHITFPDDGYVSGSHAVIFRKAGQAMIKDLDSSNGTYVRIAGRAKLQSGDLVLVGAHLFRVVLDD